MKGRKGQMLFYGLVMGLVAALIIGFTAKVNDEREFPVIGASSLKLVDASIEGEKALLYIDQSAKYSVAQSILDTAKSGGCFGQKKYGRYSLWDINNQNPSGCNPSLEINPGYPVSKNSFGSIFVGNLYGYLLKYGSVEIPQNSYIHHISDNIFRFTAGNSLEIPITKEGVVQGAYYVKPSFEINVGDYDFSDYEVLTGTADTLISTCDDERENDFKNPGQCVNDNKNIFSSGSLEATNCEGENNPFIFLDHEWETTVRYGIYGFCVESVTNQVQIYDENDKEFEPKNVEYNFALQLEDIHCGVDDHDNTECYEGISCSSYSSCSSAENICYCDNPGSQNPELACVGACLPFCSGPSSKTLDNDDETNCQDRSCSSYVECSSADTCGCSSGSYACDGSCNELLCDSDNDDQTECLSTPGGSCSDDYYDCEEASTCGCNLITACTGTCTLFCEKVADVQCLDNCGNYDSCDEYGDAGSCHCETGVACIGACTELEPEPEPVCCFECDPGDDCQDTCIDCAGGVE
jgi:hypothetical protein